MFLLLIFIGFKISLGFVDTTIVEGSSYLFIASIGIIGFILVAPAMYYYLHRLVFYKPTLIIDENGIYDNTSATSAGYIAWNEIEGVFIWIQKYRFLSQKILGITLKNKEEFLTKFHGLKKKMMRIGEYPVNIPQNAITMDIDELRDIIKSYIID